MCARVDNSSKIFYNIKSVKLLLNIDGRRGEKAGDRETSSFCNSVYCRRRGMISSRGTEN